MDTFELLLVEDDAQDLGVCKARAQDCESKYGYKVNVTEATTPAEAAEALKRPFDGAIIDLRLGRQPDAGNKVTAAITEACQRIPIAVFTGTPDTVDNEFQYVGVFKKGEITYVDLLGKLVSIHKTGLTRIMGGRGLMEQTLTKIFSQNLLPQWKAWAKHGEADSARTERALLRYTVNHLLQMLDDDADVWFREEVYIHPPLTKALRTGSIVRRKADGAAYIILTPACDLVKRGNGDLNTDTILLIAIESSAEGEGPLKNKNAREDAIKNKKLNLHWLPPAHGFVGGVVNFRKIMAIDEGKAHSDFAAPFIQASPSFVKDIVARFSSYYGRQGQPEIDRSA